MFQKDPIYATEEEKAFNALQIIKNPQNKDNPLIDPFREMVYDYQKLLRQVKKLVRLSDYQQKRLQKSLNEQLILSEISNQAYKEIDSIYSEIKNDLLFAKEIQNAILPSGQKEFLGKFFYSLYQPVSEIGGDFYDIFLLNSTTIRLLIADATGHGIRAALITMIIKTVYEVIKFKELSPAKILEIFNGKFYQHYESLNMFITACMVDIDVQSKQIHFSSAGHPPQYLLHRDSIFFLESSGKPLGIVENVQYQNQQFPFAEYDKLFLFTDGLFEQYNRKRDEFSELRIRDIVLENANKNIQEIVDNIFQQLEQFRQGRPVYDDITILGLEK